MNRIEFAQPDFHKTAQLMTLHCFNFFFALFPFINTDFILRINKKKLLAYESQKINTTKFKISQRPQIVGYRIQRLHPLFDQRVPLKPLKSNSPIIIHYGHPASTKKMKKILKIDEKQKVQQNPEFLQSFNQRVVVVKGRLKKPVTNMSQRNYLQNYHTLML